MVAIKAADFAFPRMEAPDLDAMEEFLTHFGMVRAERTPDALYMRGADSHHHLHAVHKGGTKFIGFAYHAASEDDLKRLAKLPGASGIETLNEPGGGRRVRLDRAQRLPDRGHPRHAVRGADQGRARSREHGRRAAAPQGPADAAFQVADHASSASDTACCRRPRSRRRCPGSARPWA